MVTINITPSEHHTQINTHNMHINNISIKQTTDWYA